MDNSQVFIQYSSIQADAGIQQAPLGIQHVDIVGYSVDVLEFGQFEVSTGRDFQAGI